MKYSGNIWWSDIAGPSALVTAIADSIMDGESSALLVPAVLPWSQQMRSTVGGELKEQDPELMMEYINCTGDPAYTGSASDYILSRFGPSEVQNGYRRSSGMTLPQYIHNHALLKNRVLWVRCTRKQDAAQWSSFIRQYRSRSRHDGIFIVEMYGIQEHLPGLRILNYSEYAGYFDALLFNNLEASKTTLSAEWKQYIATVMTCLCDLDVELSSWMIASFDPDKDSPLSLLEEAACDPDISSRIPFDELPATHPLRLLRDGGSIELQRAVARAQMQTLLPLIEIERLALIDCHRARIMESINTECFDFRTGGTCPVIQFGERITLPEDAEIGTLYRINHMRRAEDVSQYVLFLPESDRQRLSLLHELRNEAAHMYLCAASSVKVFLDRYPYAWGNWSRRSDTE